MISNNEVRAFKIINYKRVISEMEWPAKEVL